VLCELFSDAMVIASRENKIVQTNIELGELFGYMKEE